MTFENKESGVASTQEDSQTNRGGGLFGGLFSKFGNKSEGVDKEKNVEEQIKKIQDEIAEHKALIESGDQFDYSMKNRNHIIGKLESKLAKLAS